MDKNTQSNAMAPQATILTQVAKAASFIQEKSEAFKVRKCKWSEIFFLVKIKYVLELCIFLSSFAVSSGVWVWEIQVQDGACVLINFSYVTLTAVADWKVFKF